MARSRSGSKRDVRRQPVPLGPNRVHREHPLEIRGSHVIGTGGYGDSGLGIANAFPDQDMRVTPVDLNIAPGEALTGRREHIGLIEPDIAESNAVTAQPTPLAQSPDAPSVPVNGTGWTPETIEVNGGLCIGS